MFVLLEIGGQGPSMNDVFEYFEHQRTSVGLQDSGFIMIVTMTGMGMILSLNAVVEPGCCRTPPPSSRRAASASSAPRPSHARRCDQKG